MIKFVSTKKNIDEFLRMGRLLGFLESTTNKDEKVDAIKAARQEGLIDEDTALDLAIEFC